MQNPTRAADFFLGTTTASGFAGYFGPLCREGHHMYLIKAGPGCGKSTLMTRLAEKADGPIQRIHCASDPDSLDGLILETQGAAFVDATAPHVLEPYAPGAGETVVSLYHAIDSAALLPHKQQVRDLFDENAALRRQAAQYVGAAADLVMDSRRIAAGSTDLARVRAWAQHLAGRLLPKTRTPGTEQVRLLSAMTPAGQVFYTQTVTALADRYYVLRDETGAASRLAMEVLRREALARGCAVITCRCALHPADKIDHILLPGLRLAFLTSNRYHPCKLPGQKTIHCSRFSDAAHLERSRSRLRFARTSAAELLAQATDLMAQAKTVHDRLEDYYRPAVDFAQVDAVTQTCAARLGL